MYPRLYLETFWGMEVRSEAFVAMEIPNESGDDSRFCNVIQPAIRDVSLEANRVDVSNRGDCILTRIMDGIAHARLIVADISTAHRASGKAFRNANVMYEVGLALACRQPCEVILLKGDKDRMPFDVSPYGYVPINFADEGAARERIRDELKARIREIEYQSDARVEIALASLGAHEVDVLRRLDKRIDLQIPISDEAGRLSERVSVDRLIDKRILKMDRDLKHRPTRLGREVMKRIAPQHFRIVHMAGMPVESLSVTGTPAPGDNGWPQNVNTDEAARVGRARTTTTGHPSTVSYPADTERHNEVWDGGTPTPFPDEECDGD